MLHIRKSVGVNALCVHAEAGAGHLGIFLCYYSPGYFETGSPSEPDIASILNRLAGLLVH